MASIGVPVDLTYKAEFLGDSPAILSQFTSGKHAFAKVLKAAERPMIVIGQGALTRADGAAILATAREIA